MSLAKCPNRDSKDTSLFKVQCDDRQLQCSGHILEGRKNRVGATQDGCERETPQTRMVPAANRKVIMIEAGRWVPGTGRP